MFIPNKDMLVAGSRVKLIVDATSLLGTHTAGHEFTVVEGIEYQGRILYHLQDDEGRRLNDLPVGMLDLVI